MSAAHSSGSRASLSLAVVVEREACVTLPGEAACLALHEVVAAAPGMADEHGGTRSRKRFVVTEKAFEQRFAVAVLDVLLAHAAPQVIYI